MAVDDPHFRLRVPEGLRDRIRISAEENKRSLNTEIIARLEASFEEGGVPALYRDAFVEGVKAGFAASILDANDPIAELRRLAGTRPTQRQ